MAESSTGANVNVCTTDVSTNFMSGFTGFGHPGIDRVGYGKISDIYFPLHLWRAASTRRARRRRSRTRTSCSSLFGGCAMMCSVLALSVGHNQGTGNVANGKIRGICFPPSSFSWRSPPLAPT